MRRIHDHRFLTYMTFLGTGCSICSSNRGPIRRTRLWYGWQAGPGVAVNSLCSMRTVLFRLQRTCLFSGMTLVGTRYVCIYTHTYIIRMVWLLSCFLQASNLLYVDQPIGTGFSYTKDKTDTRHGEEGVSDDLYDFLQVFDFFFFEHRRHFKSRDNYYWKRI